MAVLFACGREDVDKPLADLLTSFGLLVVVLTLGTSAVVIVAVRTGLRPLRELADAAGSVDATSLDFRFPADRLPAELRQIAGRLNDLLARLDTAFRRERRFSADVAHELRTPIAELRTLSEVALRWPTPGGGDGAGNEADPAADATPRFREVLNALLTLLRARPDGQHPAADESAPVDLGELMDATWRPHTHAAEARGVSTRFDIPAGLTVNVDRTLLASIVGNLLSNAVRYTPERGAIGCTAEVVAGAGGGSDRLVRLAFGNTNATLTEADLPHLWEPFWRKDGARVNAAQSGLGLALVDGISRSLGLHVSAELPRPDWFVVTVSIPLSARPVSPAPPATAPRQTS
jgi:two-component system sensor histidine kinase QseC